MLVYSLWTLGIECLIASLVGVVECYLVGYVRDSFKLLRVFYCILADTLNHGIWITK